MKLIPHFNCLLCKEHFGSRFLPVNAQFLCNKEATSFIKEIPRVTKPLANQLLINLFSPSDLGTLGPRSEQ